MKFWVGITDDDWFTFLSQQLPDEVNFWQPSAAAMPNFLQPGVAFLFKLHSPRNYIAGGAFFVRFSALPSKIAWQAFGQKNGVVDYSALRARIARYRGEFRGDVEIGCNVLNNPSFWPEEDWIRVPETWARNIVRGKTFDTRESDGAMLWTQVQGRLRGVLGERAEEADQRYGSEYLTRARLGHCSIRDTLP